MVYTGRLVIVGKTGSKPFAGFVLASKSLPNRRLESRECNGESKVYVMPKQGHEQDNIRLPEVDNYPCMIARKSEKGEYTIVACNGHMSKRCITHIKEGMNPFTSLDLTLLDFTAMPNDARIGTIMHSSNNSARGYIGISDSDRIEKRVRDMS